MKHNIIICLIVGALCVFGMCQYSHAATPHEKQLLQERILRLRAEIELRQIYLKAAEAQADKIMKEEAAQKKATEEHQKKEQSPDKEE